MKPTSHSAIHNSFTTTPHRQLPILPSNRNYQNKSEGEQPFYRLLYHITSHNCTAARSFTTPSFASLRHSLSLLDLASPLFASRPASIHLSAAPLHSLPCIYRGASTNVPNTQNNSRYHRNSRRAAPPPPQCKCNSARTSRGRTATKTRLTRQSVPRIHIPRRTPRALRRWRRRRNCCQSI